MLFQFVLIARDCRLIVLSAARRRCAGHRSAGSHTGSPNRSSRRSAGGCSRSGWALGTARPVGPDRVRAGPWSPGW
ncbi:hypothetical protein HBB16_16575 [Pseudonocardia sp. MCCB 268]|nr:hypothetical protein [Pseudonocardia cytotoxica]